MHLSYALCRRIWRTIALDPAAAGGSAQFGGEDATLLHGNRFWDRGVLSGPYHPLVGAEATAAAAAAAARANAVNATEQWVQVTAAEAEVVAAAAEL